VILIKKLLTHSLTYSPADLVYKLVLSSVKSAPAYNSADVTIITSLKHRQQPIEHCTHTSLSNPGDVKLRARLNNLRPSNDYFIHSLYQTVPVIYGTVSSRWWRHLVVHGDKLVTAMTA